MSKINKTYKYSDGKGQLIDDPISIEAPLNIVLKHGPIKDRQRFSLAVTMRTPGDDKALTAGFLFTEGVIQHHKDVLDFTYRSIEDKDGKNQSTMIVDLHPNLKIDSHQLNRNIFAYSSCGLCGKTSSDNICDTFIYDSKPEHPRISPEFILSIKQRFDAQESDYSLTGSMHAAMLIYIDKRKSDIFYEDIGRHNALDKLIGTTILNNQLPLNHAVLVLSGRISFELVQKACRAGIPIIIAIGAPSTAAIELAQEREMTLIGFVKSDSFNVYCGQARVEV